MNEQLLEQPTNGGRLLLSITSNLCTPSFRAVNIFPTIHEGLIANLAIYYDGPDSRKPELALELAYGGKVTWLTQMSTPRRSGSLAHRGRRSEAPMFHRARRIAIVLTRY